MTHRVCACVFALVTAASLTAACGGWSASTFADEAPREDPDSGGGFPSFPDSGTAAPPAGVVLVHAAAFPAFRLCFENYPDLRPQPDSKIMPNANVVGVEVGSAVRIGPLSRAPGRVFVIDRREVEVAPGDAEPTCGALICDREAGPLRDGCLRRGQDYDETAPIDRPLGIDRVDLLAISGCGNGMVLSNLGVDPSACEEGWQFKGGALGTKLLELSPQIDPYEPGLAVQVVHLAPMVRAARLEITFGPLAEGAIEHSIAVDPPLFATTAQQAIPIDRDEPAFYGTYGFRIALAPAPPPDGGETAAARALVVEQSLAEIQDLSAPRDVPASYYGTTSSYALLLLGDPAIRKTLDDGDSNPGYSPRRGLHLLAVPIRDPDAVSPGADSGDGSAGTTGRAR